MDEGHNGVSAQCCYQEWLYWRTDLSSVDRVKHIVQASIFYNINWEPMIEPRFSSDSSPKLCRQLQTPLPKYSNVGRFCTTPCGAGEDCHMDACMHRDNESPLHRSACMFEWQSPTKYSCPGICTVTANQQGQHLLHYCLFGCKSPWPAKLAGLAYHNLIMPDVQSFSILYLSVQQQGIAGARLQRHSMCLLLAKFFQPLCTRPAGTQQSADDTQFLAF